MNAFMFVLGLKSDKKRKVSTEEVQKYASEIDALVCETSAKSNLNVKEAIELAIDACLD